jgi:hypothetical protein
MRFRAFDAGVGILPAPIFPRFDREPDGPGIDLALIDIPAEFVRLPAVEARSLDARDALRQSNGDHVRGNMRRIFLMVTQSGHWIFHRGGAVGKGRRPDGRVANRRRVEGEKRVGCQFQIVERRDFHEEIVGMLSVCNWSAIRRLALLEKQRIAPLRDGGGFQAQHDPSGKYARAKFSLCHGHEPIRREEFVSPSRAGLLLIQNENVGMKHERPGAPHGHEHRRRGGNGLGARAGGCVTGNRLQEVLRMHVHKVRPPLPRRLVIVGAGTPRHVHARHAGLTFLRIALLRRGQCGGKHESFERHGSHSTAPFARGLPFSAAFEDNSSGLDPQPCGSACPRAGESGRGRRRGSEFSPHQTL